MQRKEKESDSFDQKGKKRIGSGSEIQDAKKKRVEEIDSSLAAEFDLIWKCLKRKNPPYTETFIKTTADAAFVTLDKELSDEKLTSIMEWLREQGYVTREDFRYGLPPLGKRCASTAPSSENEKHSEAVLVEMPFGSIDCNNPRIAAGLPAARNLTALNQTFKCLQDSVKCYNELSAFRFRANIWVVASDTGVPIGVIEAKLPGASIMSRPLVHGQILDDMLHLRTFYGLRNVFGIVSTYEEWRFYWLPDTDAVATATKLPERRENETYPCTPQQPKPLENIENGKGTRLAEKTPYDRVIHGSQVFAFNDPLLPTALCSVLLKMWTSPMRRVQIVDVDRLYIVMDHEKWFWTTLDFCGNIEKHKLDFSTTPSTETRFVLLRDFKGGAEGRAWLACSFNGEVCVIKFMRTRRDAPSVIDQLEIEKAHWKSCWGIETRISRIGGDQALIMPYAQTLPDRRSTKDEQLVHNAISELAEKNLCHDDLHWRHVGKLANGRIIFFDLSRVSEVQADEARKRMLTQLQLDPEDDHSSNLPVF